MRKLRYISLILCLTGLLIGCADGTKTASTDRENAVSRDNAAARSVDQSVYASPLPGGPHLDGDAYRALRGDGPVEVLEFDASALGGNWGKTVSVTLGPDFCIEQSETHATLYDFRYRRILQISPESRTFLNDSLFGFWQMRLAFLGNNIRTAGRFVSGKTQEEKALSRFWVEQENGLDIFGDPFPDTFPLPLISVKKTEDAVSVSAVGTNVATFQRGANAFPSDSHSSSFAAWLVWSLHLHPAVAAEAKSMSMLPASINRIMNPKIFGDTLESNIAITNVTRSRNGMEILSGLASAPPVWEPYIPRPLAELMLSAVQGEATNGPISDAQYLSEIEKLIAQDKVFDAWLVATNATHPYDGCPSDEFGTPLCNVADEHADAFKSDPATLGLLAALGVDQQGRHADAARLFILLRPHALERPDILEFVILNALVEGRIKEQLDGELNQELDNFLLRIETAFREDPYNPARYRDYFGYVHAMVSEVPDNYLVRLRAYALLDLGRSLPGRRTPEMLSSIRLQEQKMERESPVHFPDYPQ